MALTYTYDEAALNEALNEIRAAIGDTGPDFRLSDEFILSYAPGGVLEESSNHAAAITIVRKLISKYTGVVDVSEGGASFSGSQLVAQYRQTLADLLSEIPISATSVLTVTGTGTGYGPAFTRNMGDSKDGTYGVTSTGSDLSERYGT